jgi:AcrR family transcriptional regulator
MAAIEGALADRRPGEPVLAAVRRGVIDFVTEFMDDPALYVTRARLALGEPELLGPTLVQFARIEAVIAAAAAEDLDADPTDVRPRLIGAAAAAAIRSTSQAWVARDGRGDPREIVNESFDLLERGLGHR